jgi:CRISPR/Cas system-associated endonuclease Cas1
MTCGFDPACGVLHSDRDRTDALCFDLMEIFRPDVDDMVLNLLRKTTFTY